MADISPRIFLIYVFFQNLRTLGGGEIVADMKRLLGIKGSRY